MSDDLLARLRKYDAYDCCDQRVEAADEIERLRRERDKATLYAENLAWALSRNFPHVPQWRPLTGDLIGLLTQIDNMIAGISFNRAKVEHLQKALERIANGDVPRPMGERWRSDGAPSKHDTCTHRKPMWMECPHCVEDYARSEQERR
jgi:hypothetical protein